MIDPEPLDTLHQRVMAQLYRPRERPLPLKFCLWRLSWYRALWGLTFGRRQRKWRWNESKSMLLYDGSLTDLDVEAIKRWHEHRMREMG